MPSPTTARPRPGLAPLQTGLLVVLVLVFLASIGLRAYVRMRADGSVPGGAHGLVDDSGRPVEEPLPPSLTRSLPYVTEGSFFALLGFALGYATRKFVKLGLILLALFFVALQALVWTGTVAVDWSGMLGKLNALLFNLQADESMQQFWTRRIPSAGGMFLGYLIGFKRG